MSLSLCTNNSIHLSQCLGLLILCGAAVSLFKLDERGEGNNHRDEGVLLLSVWQVRGWEQVSSGLDGAGKARDGKRISCKAVLCKF